MEICFSYTLWRCVYINSTTIQFKKGEYSKLKKIVSKTTIVLSVILFVISICPITSMECFRGKLPLQDAIINSADIIYGINYGNMSYLPHKQIPLFYIGLILIIISSIICFEKSDKFKGLIGVVLSIAPVVFIIITHNYPLFLILINLYLIIHLFMDFTLKNKIIITGNIIGIIIVILNIIQLVQHLQLVFSPIDILTFQAELVILSDVTLKIFTLWLIPYTILLINDIIIFRKSSRTVK